MTFGVNTSPLAGREGKYVTSRQIKARLEREVLGNVSIEVRPAESSEAFEVRGRGELQLAVLIEQMRREGFELTASRPEVLLRGSGDDVQEPYERITIDIPPDYIGEVQTAHGRSKGPPRPDVHRRRRPRPDGVRPPGPWPDRLSRPAADRHARDGDAPPDRRGVRAVGGRGDPPHQRRPRVGPRRHVERLRPVQPRAARDAVHRRRRRGLRGDDRRREQPVGRHGRQPDQGEEAHQHPDALARRVIAADAREDPDPRIRRSSSSPATSSSRSRRSRSGFARGRCRSTTVGARWVAPRISGGPPSARRRSRSRRTRAGGSSARVVWSRRQATCSRTVAHIR